jgi:hypothetical protein
MSVPTTMGRDPRVPFAAWFWTFGCSSAVDDLDFAAFDERVLLFGTHVEGGVKLLPQLKGFGR